MSVRDVKECGRNVRIVIATGRRRLRCGCVNLDGLLFKILLKCDFISFTLGIHIVTWYKHYQIHLNKVFLYLYIKRELSTDKKNTDKL